MLLVPNTTLLKTVPSSPFCPFTVNAVPFDLYVLTYLPFDLLCIEIELSNELKPSIFTNVNSSAFSNLVSFLKNSPLEEESTVAYLPLYDLILLYYQIFLFQY